MRLFERTLVLVALAGLTLILTACRSPDSEKDGFDPSQLSRLVVPQTADSTSPHARLLTAVVVLDPATALKCKTPLPEWLAWQSPSSRRLVLVLTRSPDAYEKREFRMLRLTVAGTLPPSPGRRAANGVYLFRGRSLVDSISLFEGQLKAPQDTGEPPRIYRRPVGLSLRSSVGVS